MHCVPEANAVDRHIARTDASTEDHRAGILNRNTVYLEQAVAALERQGTPIPAECLPHLSPLGWEPINLTGD